MAFVTFQSVQTATSTTTTAVVTKPVGLQVGDLMIGLQVAQLQSGLGDLTPPSAGWNAESLWEGDTFPRAIYSKIADANDVAATNFTFTRAAGGGNGCMVAAIARFTGPNTDDPVDQLSGQGGSGSGPISVPTITPSAGGSTMLMVGMYWHDVSRSFSAYSITNNNPSWTEAFDLTSSASSPTLTVGLSMAYASRPQITATGSGSIEISGEADLYRGFLVSLGPSLIPAASMTITGNPLMVWKILPHAASAAFTGLVPTIDIIAKKWSSLTKNASSWVNQDKS